MQRFWLMRFLWACLLLVGITNPAFAGGKIPATQTWGGSCNTALSYGGSISKISSVPTTGLFLSRDTWACKNSAGGTLQTQDQMICVDSAFPDYVNWLCKCPVGTTKIVGSPNDACVCPSGKVQNATTGLCEDPPPAGCQYPFEDDGAGGCKCPGDQVKVGEACVAPDCSKKQQACSTSCGGAGGDMSGVAYFYCESATDVETSTIIFSDDTYKCECAPTTPGCPTGQIGITATKDGALTCGSPKNPGCPTGSYYGDFNGQTGCIKPDEHNDPDETPKNCIQGMEGVYFGSTLYCVPPKDTTSCPTGTTSFVTDTGLKICKGTDQQGNPTGDSPDTNGYIKGTATSGSGVNPEDNDNSGEGISSGEEQIADKLDASNAQLDAIKSDTGGIKQSSSLTAANTDAIKNAVTGSASTTAQGSFAESTAQIQTEVETLKTQYASTLNSVKGQMTNFLSNVTTPTGAGALPCYDSIHIPVLNIDFSLCFTQFEQALSVIGNYIYGIAFLFAGLIILGSTRGEG